MYIKGMEVTNMKEETKHDIRDAFDATLSPWKRFGDTPEAACARLEEMWEERIRQVDALYAMQKRLCALLSRFVKNPYLRSLTHDQNAELTSAVDNASGALKELGY